MKRKRRPNSMRHPAWHYGSAGAYFITICTHQKEWLFDTAVYRAIAEQQWQRIPSYKSATTIRLDEWVVMPNHIHGVLLIVDGASFDNHSRPRKTVSGTVGAVVGAYKAAVAKQINQLRGEVGCPVWQRGYYDRIIRNESELNKTRFYIQENPGRWADDTSQLDMLLTKMDLHT